MQRKRRNRPTWFPILGTDFQVEGQRAGTIFVAPYTLSPPIQEGAIGGAATIPLLDDNDTPEDADNQSLRDRVEGKDYAIGRIVGKIWGSMPQRVPQPQPSPTENVVAQAVFCAAIAVLPVDEAGDPEGSDDDYNPLYSKNSAKPYMWRRTWTLYNNVANNPDQASVTPPAYTGPTNVLNSGSGLLDAGHVDVKSRRRVRKEERLFLIVAWQSILHSVPGLEANTLFIADYGYDLRILGGMRKSHNASVLT